MKRLIYIPALLGCLLIACKKETQNTPAKQQCEISNTGTIKIVNKTSYAVTVQIDGGTPSNMGYLSPDAEASVDVSAGTSHSVKVKTVQGSSSNLTWDLQKSIGACLTEQINLIL